MRFIESLRLTDFRSYDRLDLTLTSSPVVLFGKNGAGKTNLLEAISFLSPGRGLRRARLEDIARQSGDLTASAWGINARIDNKKLSVGQVPEYPRRRLLRIDDSNATGAELARCMTLMWLTPAQDGLFTGGATDRRKFIDRFSLSHTPTHGAHMLRYEKARSERNRLLSDNVQDDRWFTALEADMAKYGTLISEARVKTVLALMEEVSARPESVFPKSRIALEGDIEDMWQSGLELETIQDSVRQRLSDNRGLDYRAGRSLWGVHKSDLKVSHKPKDMPAEHCSTGEQKALLIGLIMAHARAQKMHDPILLLDEVAAHLDETRRAALIEELLDLGTQVFMTGTDASLFEAFNGRAQMFEVKDSQLNQREL